MKGARLLLRLTGMGDSRHLRACSAALAIILLAAASSWADSLSQVSSQSQQAPNDSVQWSQLGTNGTDLASSFTAHSNGGTSVTVGLNGSNSMLSEVCPSSTCSWAGPAMPSGDTLIWTSNGNNGG